MFLSDDKQLPVQLYHHIGDGVRCYRAVPSDDLQEYIYYYWWLDVASDDVTLEVIPDNAVDLVMCPQIENFSIVYLPASEKFTIPLSGPITYVGISFRAESVSRFFNVSKEEMTELSPGDDTTRGLAIETLVEGVQALTQPQQLADYIDPLVSARLSAIPAALRTTAKLNVEKALARCRHRWVRVVWKTLPGNLT